jgi:hypothetical protein
MMTAQGLSQKRTSNGTTVTGAKSAVSRLGLSQNMFPKYESRNSLFEMG